MKTGYTLHVPSTPPTIRSTTPNSEDLPPYETPPLSANITNNNDSSFDGIYSMNLMNGSYRQLDIKLIYE